jgi:hypothetical protein
MKLTQVKFCSLFSYTPHGSSQEAEKAKAYTYALKDDTSPSVLNPFFMPEYVVEKLQG